MYTELQYQFQSELDIGKIWYSYCIGRVDTKIMVFVKANQD